MPEDSSPTNSKGSIIIAEDETSYAEIYKWKLIDQGYEVEIVDNGEALFQFVQAKKPDIILLDIMMPKKDGLETLKDLKDDDDLKDIPVIMLSNLGEEKEIQKSKEIGAIDFLVKSNIAFQDVMDKISEYIQKK